MPEVAVETPPYFGCVGYYTNEDRKTVCTDGDPVLSTHSAYQPVRSLRSIE